MVAKEPHSGWAPGPAPPFTLPLCQPSSRSRLEPRATTPLNCLPAQRDPPRRLMQSRCRKAPIETATPIYIVMFDYDNPNPKTRTYLGWQPSQKDLPLSKKPLHDRDSCCYRHAGCVTGLRVCWQFHPRTNVTSQFPSLQLHRRTEAPGQLPPRLGRNHANLDPVQCYVGQSRRALPLQARQGAQWYLLLGGRTHRPRPVWRAWSGL